MDKDKQNNANRKALQENSSIIFNPNFFGILISNRSVNYRKPLYKILNEQFPPGKSDAAWKKYFLYPERIPKNGREVYIKAMEKALYSQIELMEENLIDSCKSLTNKHDEINKLLIRISDFKEVYHNN